MSIATTTVSTGDVVEVICDDGGKKRIAPWTEGGQFGSASTDLVGFYGATPVDQPAAVANSSGTGDVVAQLNALLSRMRELGLIAT